MSSISVSPWASGVLGAVENPSLSLSSVKAEADAEVDVSCVVSSMSSSGTPSIIFVSCSSSDPESTEA